MQPDQQLVIITVSTAAAAAAATIEHTAINTTHLHTISLCVSHLFAGLGCAGVP
jgi:hypothetical protein